MFPIKDAQIATRPAAGLWQKNTLKNITSGLWSCKHSFFWGGITQDCGLNLLITTIMFYLFSKLPILVDSFYLSVFIFLFFNIFEQLSDHTVKLLSFFPVRDDFSSFLKFMGHLSYQCDKLLGDKELMGFLQGEHYDMAVLDGFNPCSFIVARKLGTSAALVRISAS